MPARLRSSPQRKITRLILGMLMLYPCAAAEATRPNVVFVLFDDLGWGQPQSYNPGSALRTPNLDRLAQEGMRFTDAHSASAVCTPTRYGALTGRYPWRIGRYGVLETYSKPIIPTDRMTVASFLKQQGYATACIGKWHLGLNWGPKNKDADPTVIPLGTKMTDGPNALGFDYFCGFTHSRNIGTVIEQDRVVAQVEPVENQPLMLKKALEWIERRKASEPFFLYFSMCPPHLPVVPAPEYVGQSGAEDRVKKDPRYGDWLFQGDAMLGRILAALERKHLAENTIVIAASDNGAEHRSYEPLRESKRSIYEGGHRVPFVVRWPGQVKPGSINPHTVCLNDLLATVAEAVGAKLPDNAGEDSVSLLPEFRGTATVGVREATVHQSSRGDLALRQGPWKLVFLEDGAKELYDLETDLSETKDLAAARPEVVVRLSALMQRTIDDGRSTPGAPQKNAVLVSLKGGRRQPPAVASGEPE